MGRGIWQQRFMFFSWTKLSFKGEELARRDLRAGESMIGSVIHGSACMHTRITLACVGASVNCWMLWRTPYDSMRMPSSLHDYIGPFQSIVRTCSRRPKTHTRICGASLRHRTL